MINERVFNSKKLILHSAFCFIFLKKPLEMFYLLQKTSPATEFSPKRKQFHTFASKIKD